MQNRALGRNNSWKQFCWRPSCLWTGLGKWPRCWRAASHEGSSSILGCRSKDVARKLRNYPPLLIIRCRRKGTTDINWKGRDPGSTKGGTCPHEGHQTGEQVVCHLHPWGPEGHKWTSGLILLGQEVRVETSLTSQITLWSCGCEDIFKNSKSVNLSHTLSALSYMLRVNYNM